MSIFQTIIDRLRAVTGHRRAPVFGPLADLAVSDLDLGDKLARTARLTERLAVLSPDDMSRRQREALMLRALANVYYCRAGMFLPHPGPESAFPAVYPLLQQMKTTGDRREQASALAQIRTLLHAASPYDAALDAIGVLATYLPVDPHPRPAVRTAPARSSGQDPARPGRGGPPGAPVRGATLAQQFPRPRPAPVTPAAIAPVLHSPATRFGATSATGRRR